MSNSNYSIGLQCLKPVHTAYSAMHAHQETVKLVLGTRRKWPRPRRWQFFSRRDRDETLVRLETETSRPRPQPCGTSRHVAYLWAKMSELHFGSHIQTPNPDRNRHCLGGGLGSPSALVELFRNVLLRTDNRNHANWSGFERVHGG